MQFSGARSFIGKNGKPAFYRDSKAEKYRKTIHLLALPYAPASPLQGYIRLDVIFVLPRPQTLMRKSDPAGLIPHNKRPDRTNLLKGTEDALSLAGFWQDDAQIFSGTLEKYYAEKGGEPRIEVRITEIP